MNQKAIQDAYNLFTESGYKKSIDDFKSLIKTNPNALNDSYELFKSKGYSKDIESYKSLVGVSEPEKKNSVSTGTTPQEVSSTPLQGQSTTLGGEDKEKPKPLVSSGGETPKSYKNKEGREIIYVNKDPKRGVVNEIPKDIPDGYSYKVIGNSEELRRWKEQQSKPKVQTATDFSSSGSEFSKVKGVLDLQPKGTVVPKNKDISKNKIIADNAFDYANKNSSKEKAIERLEDEVNTKQFSDGVIQGLKNVYNLGIAAPLSAINTLLGGNKDFTIKKSIPLEVESIQAEKDLKKEGIEPTKELILQRAKEIFIDNDLLEQKHKLIDEALPSGYDREGVWKELKLEQLKSNDILRGAVASAEVWSSKIEEYKSFVSKLDKNGDSIFDSDVTDEDINTYDRLTAEATEAQKNLVTMSKNFDKYLSKANSDEEKLELFKYNYNDWEKSLSNIISGTKDIAAGSMKLGIETLFSEGPEGQPSLVRDISEISDEILSETEKDRKQFFRYKATSLNSFGDLASFMGQLGSEQLPIVGSIILGGNTGVLLTSMSSGGQKIKELEDQAKQPGGVAYSQGMKLTAGWLYTGVNYWPQKFGTQRIIKDLEKTIASASTLTKRGLSNTLLKELPKGIARGTYYSQLEGISERATAEGEIIIDEDLLGIVMTNAEKNEMRDESYLSGSLMGFGMNGVGGAVAFGVAQAKLYSDSKSVKEVKDLMDRINVLSSEVDSNPNLTKQEVTSIYTEMNRLTNIAYDIVSANAKKGIDLSIEAKGFLVDIDTRQAQLKDEFSNLPNSNFSQEYKDNRRKEITSEFDLLENKRQSIIGGGFNVLMTLNDKEVFNLKNKAERELINEAKEKGDKEFTFTDEQITERAIDNYEKQRKETTAKEPIEKRPTGEQEVEAATTAEGQQDKVLQEAKDNVEVLPKSNQINNNVIEYENGKGEKATLSTNDIELYFNEDKRKFVFSENGNRIGHIELGEQKGNEVSVKLSGIFNPSLNRKGIGTIMYEQVAKHLKEKYNVDLVSDTNRSADSEALWKKLEREGKATKEGNIYKYKNEATPTNITPTDGNIQPGVGNMAEVGLQEAKDNVELLRKEEIAEFEKEIENPQDFITDGKVDAKKVEESDNAKAKEIYAKYDAKIKPLLDNIKTQEAEVVTEEATDYKVISQKVLDKKELNTVRASLRASSPDSFALEVLDAVAKGEVLGYDSELDSTIESMIENGVSINNVANLILQDDVITEKKGINSKRKAIDYALNIGAKGTMLKAGQQAVLDNIKTQEDAIQKQSTGEGVLRPGQPKVGLQEVVEGDQKPEGVTEEVKSKEEVESIFDLDKDSDLKDDGVLDKAIKFLDDIDKGLTTFRKENMSSVLIPAPAIQVAVKAMREALKTAKNIGELIQAGVDALKGTDWYQKLDKKTKKSIEGELATSLSQYAFKEQQRKAIRDENRKIESKLKSNRKSAIANIKKGKFGSLTNTSKSDKSTIVDHETMKVKVLNLAMLLPNIVKKSISSDLFKRYSNALNALSGRGKAIDTKVSAQEVADLYDQIIEDYTNFAEIQNAINNGDESVLTDEQKVFYENNKESFSKPKVENKADDTEASEEREQKIDDVMSLIPSLFDSIKDYDLNSMSFNIIKLFSNLNRADLELMTNAQLENFNRTIEAIYLGEDIPSYANEAYKNIVANRNKAITHGVNQRQNVTGVRKFKAARAFLSAFDGIKGLFGDTFKTSIQSRTSRYPRTSIDAANKIFGSMPKFEDAVNGDYKSIPIYNYIISSIVKAEGLWKTREEEVVGKFQSAYNKLFKSSNDIDESFRKIHFAFLQLQAWGNPGNKKVKNGVISFSENFLNKDTPYSDKDKAKYKEFVDKYKGYQFVRSNGEVLVFDENNNDVTNEYFSKEEMNAYNTIRAELDKQKQRAEEASLFHNNNALPFVNEYFPENNFSKTASKKPLTEDPLSQSFNSDSSVKSKNLEEKTAVAHPVQHNPFALALTSIKGTELQYQLLNPIQIARMTLNGIISDINKQERAGNGDSRSAELSKVYQNISGAVDKLTNQIINYNIGEADALDKVSDFFIGKFYTAALASLTRTIADMTLNYAHLAISKPSAMMEGINIRKKISKYIKDNKIEVVDDFYRNILRTLGSSEINRMLSVVNTTSTRAEFQQEGASADITRKGVESKGAVCTCEDVFKESVFI
jgi:hypothetical protein